MQLSELCDLVAYGDYITERTKYGKRPHRSDEWGYTRRFMREYGDPADTEEVIRLLQGQDLPNEVEAARWLLKHDKLVP
jgi:hypothetical protein